MGLTRTGLTPADVMNLPDPPRGSDYELSDGELILVGKAGARHELTKSRILDALFGWRLRTFAGKVFSETMFRLGEHTARIPDAAVVLTGRAVDLPEEDVPMPFAPDLAVEIISVSESARDAEKKVWEYLRAGVEEVWQVYPDERFVRVRRAGGSLDFTESQTLTSEVLVGFEARVERFFVG